MVGTVSSSTVTYGATSVANVLLTTGPVAIAGTAEFAPDAPDGGRRHRRQRQRRPAGRHRGCRRALRLTGARLCVDGIADLDVSGATGGGA